MRQSFLVTLGVSASLAVQGHAYYSNWWTDWKGMMQKMDCANGPVACGEDENGDDINCMDGYACYHSSVGYSVCDDVARY